ncbi:hypothetical protein GHK50_20925 [Sinorhizobium medicae]|uniref:Uncharacterized protein n=1 Tax=Sinorhizobium medicae TaxID=110321 RepID=A0A6G1WUL5_9HYPH|nr:hypothetical protein [Sinorhizobium medicae]MQW73434.1 hypothetical protein [Sinorhizobium medicae]MQX85530.1 hypothetical protein [Sinorhizobium medicae]
MDDATLFNCCTHYATPDWSQFDWLEIGGCVSFEEDGETYTEGGFMASEAEFFTVYGHLREGGCEAITDTPTLELADTVGEHLATLSGLPLHHSC